ncbi:MAG: hypothetical protein PUC14_01495 [Bacteroidales bacterium]|nr:hypothetical protein [Bacteroidales bacterium]
MKQLKFLLAVASIMFFSACSNVPNDTEMVHSLIIGKWKVVESRMPHSELKWCRDWGEALGSQYFIFTDNIVREINIDDYTSDEFYNPCTNDTTYDKISYYRIIEKRGDMFLEIYDNYGDGNELWERFEIKRINDKKLHLECDKNPIGGNEWDVDYKLEKIY